MGAVDRIDGRADDGVERAIIDAAGRLMERWGVTKTTVADLANEAGCSRATVYRAFPGGKQQIMAIYGLSELRAFFDEASSAIGDAANLDDALVAAITTATRGLAGHAGFQFMLAHEPGLVLPYLGFSQIDRLYRVVTDALAPAFERFVGDRAAPLIELATRITLSHVFQPSPVVDLTDERDVRRLVENHLIPTVQPALAASA